jgi:glutamate N-acetyltransferase/amino-acid N-acetyltransferase
MAEWKHISGGVTAAGGYRAAGVHSGIKFKNADLALVVSQPPAAVAGTFTLNKVQAAPVKLCRTRLAGGKASAIVINSGSANACTGPQGILDAEQMAQIAAQVLGVPEETVFCCSTGTIGKPLPMDKIKFGISLAAASLSEHGGDSAAKAIMTTDAVEKQIAVELLVDGRTVRVGGMCKGAGMIAPNMATMLGFVTTDAAVEQPALQECLLSAVQQSFNRITVDGDQSTNDTVLLLANGLAGNRPLNPAHPAWFLFCAAVTEVCRELAFKIVKDGEGATRFVTVTVKGAASDADAAKAARSIANSLLVKTSWYGGDPNWGRVNAAVGYSGAEVDPDRVEIRFDGVCAVRAGQKAPEFALKELEKIMAQKAFGLEVDLHLGQGSDTVYTCDCSIEYVKINSEYTT